MDSTRIKGENQPMLPALAPVTRPFDLVGLGEASLDLVVTLEAFPEPDGKTAARDQRRLPGGQVATAVRAAARLGWRAAFLGAVGDDEAGRLVLAALAEDGVDVSGARRAGGVATRSAIILGDLASGTRSVIGHRNRRLNLPAGALPAGVVQGARVLLADGTDLAASVAASRVARASGVRVVVDVDEAASEVSPLLVLADVVIASEGFVQTARGGTVDAGLFALAERCPTAAAVCVTLGRRGCRAVAGGFEVSVPAFAVSCVDSTGAGDVFRAGFIAAWLASPDGADLSGVLRYASAAAALSCRAVGAQGGLPTDREVRALLDSGGGVTG